jgi:purine-nucleoside phosphorylase
MIVENNIFSEKPSNNKNSFPHLAPNVSWQTPDNLNILAVTMENAGLYYSQIFYKTEIWGNLK